MTPPTILFTTDNEHKLITSKTVHMYQYRLSNLSASCLNLLNNNYSQADRTQTIKNEISLLHETLTDQFLLYFLINLYNHSQA